jgi:hypothetical protein
MYQLRPGFRARSARNLNIWSSAPFDLAFIPRPLAPSAFFPMRLSVNAARHLVSAAVAAIFLVLPLRQKYPQALGLLAPLDSESSLSILLVVRQVDCRKHFFDLFMEESQYGAGVFRKAGGAVVWSRKSGERSVLVKGVDGKEEVLSTPVQVKSILYGVRYWALKELALVDEFFREDRGSVIFPVSLSSGASVEATVRDILSEVRAGDEWTTLSLADLAVTCCEQRHRPLGVLRRAIRELSSHYPGQVVLVPTSRAFATISTRSRQREELELSAYYLDARKRFISHIKVHRSLSDHLRWKAI